MNLSPATKAVGDGLIAAIKDSIARAIAPRDSRLAALEARIARLEQRKGFEYRGIWSDADVYEADDFVTHDGSLWHTDATTRDRPGSDGSPWQLAVKRGKDGRAR